MLFTKKSVVLITGATGEIGIGFATQFAKVLAKDSHIIVTSRSFERLQELKKKISTTNPNVQVSIFQWNLAKPNSENFQEDIENAIGRDAKFDNAIVVHEACHGGNLQHTVLDVGSNFHLLQDVNNVNLVSPLAITSAFFKIFEKASNKTVVNVTGGDNPMSGFSYLFIGKIGLKMALDILAIERKDIKVLHYVPGIVRTENYTRFIKESINKHVAGMFQMAIDQKMTMTGDHVGKVLVDLLGENSFESGAYLRATHEGKAEKFAPFVNMSKEEIEKKLKQ